MELKTKNILTTFIGQSNATSIIAAIISMLDKNNKFDYFSIKQTKKNNNTHTSYFL
jgi:hypothetical protein